MRAYLFQKILSDLRGSNSKTTNHKLNRTIQTVLFNLVTSDRTSPKSLWAIKITREMWKRQLWTDSKAIEIMKETALADNEKVVVGGVRFFLGGDKEREEMEDESSDGETVNVGKVRYQAQVKKKSNKSARAVDKAVATVKKRERKKNQPHPLNFSAFHLLHDPQGFAEQLFSKHLQNTKSKLNLEQKLLVLQLVSRLVGLHKLIMIQIYSYFLKFLTPRQPSVTSFLASLAQSVHNLIPPEDIEPLVQKIANEFVSEASAAEVASAGLNAIREICARQPLAMSDTLLQDLVQYRKSKDKGVVMAARGLLSLYREVGPDLLHKKDRGRDATMELRAGIRKEARYGDEPPGEIEGIELLEQWKDQERRRKRRERGLPSDGEDDEDEDEKEEETGWDRWDVESDGSDDSGGWINVESDDEIVVSDSDDEKEDNKDNEPASKKARTNSRETSTVPSQISATTTEKKPSKLATTKILTPADLAKLTELRAQKNVESLLPQARRGKQIAARHADDPLTAAEIEGLAALSGGKPTREEKVAHVKESKTDRSEHKSRAAKKHERKLQDGKSTTNKEKARQKNFFMTLGKAKSKGKRSLVETRKVLRTHQERTKRGGRRGNW